MKYVIVLGDGMAGLPLQELGNRTTLDCADTPVMDLFASAGELGTVSNVPPGMSPGSDVANLAVLGYDPERNYSGRSPLEALSVGVDMKPTDVILRCNLVTLTQDAPYDHKTILDHSASEISTQDADILMDAVRQAFANEEFSFYTGTSYRHITVWDHGSVVPLEPPHDHLGQVIGPWLPEQPLLRSMMERSFAVLNDHPLNRRREELGLNKANSLWFWGAGTRPSLGSFRAKTGMKAAMISAVDLLKGIAVGAEIQVVSVPGANGSLHTNYEGKAQAAVDALLRDGCDLVYIHVEAPDEMGHQGNMSNKLQAISYLDSRIIAPVKAALDDAGEDYRFLVLPDHPTPVCHRTHTTDPVPYVIFDSRRQRRTLARYTEAEAAAAGCYEPRGYRLMARFLEQEES